MSSLDEEEDDDEEDDEEEEDDLRKSSPLTFTSLERHSRLTRIRIESSRTKTNAIDGSRIVLNENALDTVATSPVLDLSISFFRNSNRSKFLVGNIKLFNSKFMISDKIKS